MEKNDIFTFTSSDGVEVTGIVIEVFQHSCYLCYAQNELFLGYINTDSVFKVNYVLVERCIIPELDEYLARHNDIEVAKAENAIGM